MRSSPASAGFPGEMMVAVYRSRQALTWQPVRAGLVQRFINPVCEFLLDELEVHRREPVVLLCQKAGLGSLARSRLIAA